MVLCLSLFLKSFSWLCESQSSTLLMGHSRGVEWYSRDHVYLFKWDKLSPLPWRWPRIWAVAHLLPTPRGPRQAQQWPRLPWAWNSNTISRLYWWKIKKLVFSISNTTGALLIHTERSIHMARKTVQFTLTNNRNEASSSQTNRPMWSSRQSLP